MWKSALSPCQCWIGLFLQPLLELVGEKWHPEFNEFDDRFQQWWENKTNQLVLQRGLKPSIWRSHHDELELFFSNPLNWEVKVVWDDWLICYSGGNFGSFYLQNFLICRTTKSRGENFLSIVQLKSWNEKGYFDLFILISIIFNVEACSFVCWGEMLKLIKTIPSRCHISFPRISICLGEESNPV